MKPKANIETWFNNSMSRASSTFAAKMKTLSIIVALVIALIANIDSLHLARTLWEDPILRQQLNAVATQALESGELQAAMDTSNQANLEAVSGTGGEADVLEDIAQSGQAVAATVQEINDLRLPIGWLLNDLSDRAPEDPLRSSPNNIWNYLPWNNPEGWLGLLLTKLMGIAATVISISQGAPFWFNILNKIMSR